VVTHAVVHFSACICRSLSTVTAVTLLVLRRGLVYRAVWHYEVDFVSVAVFGYLAAVCQSQRDGI